ncbi:MAG TPA: hypothetical protein VE046_07265 [Steroidobacteraceae bacterium]|nr:hypothetical protein [Steroidobacteraceae bacterium]
MSKLRIQIHNRNGQTVSKIINRDLDTIVFINKETAPLLITTDAPGSVFCELNATTKIPEPVTIGGNARREVAVCTAFPGKEFKYTAQVGAAAPEDPMIIIERGSHPVLVVSGLTLAAVAVVTFVLGFVTARLISRNRSAAPG